LSKIILIYGPTASGKSKFALKIARKINGEIINADSMQVYKKLKILTARPSKEDLKKIKHNLYGFIDINKTFSTGDWLKFVIRKIKEITNKNKVPIIVGGTGLYFFSLVEGFAKLPTIPIKFRNKIRNLNKKIGQKKFYENLSKLDPLSKNKINPNDVQRSIRAYEVKKYSNKSIYEWQKKTKKFFDNKLFVKLYLNYEREDLLKRISIRTKKMIKYGAVSEVKNLLKKKNITKEHYYKIIGFKEIEMFLEEKIDKKNLHNLIDIRTRQYAKRQTTWFRGKMESWTLIDPKKLTPYIKKLNKSSLKLDQLI
tara:strand:+ start:2573 stop:3505 length:933 start_codon:yes stop_codon:yes gene_type:complete